MATERGVLEVLTVLSAAFPQFKLAEATVRVYTRVLADIDDKLIEAAAYDCLARCRFFPSVAELRDAAHAIAAPALPSAFEAWEEVLRQIRDVGAYRTPTFTDPRIEAAVRQVGGWSMLCRSENVAADRARFLEAYDRAQRAEDHAAKTLPQVKALTDRLRADRRMLAAASASTETIKGDAA